MNLKMSKINRKGITKWVDPAFVKILNEIKKTRVMLGKDDFNSVTADWRITLAMSRHPLMERIKEDIINNDLNNKK